MPGHRGKRNLAKTGFIDAVLAHLGRGTLDVKLLSQSGNRPIEWGASPDVSNMTQFNRFCCQYPEETSANTRINRNQILRIAICHWSLFSTNVSAENIFFRMFVFNFGFGILLQMSLN